MENEDLSIVDLIESNDLSTEIYDDKNKLYNYIVSLEEAVEEVDKLQSQYDINNNILENNLEITDETISIANETLAISCSVLGNTEDYDKYRVSTEINITRYEMLKLSNEGIGDLIKKIIDKIVMIFQKVIIMFKKIYAKIILWINPYEKRIQDVKKDIMTILQSSDIILPKDSITKVVELVSKCKLPISRKNDTTSKELLNIHLDVTSSFERLLSDKNLESLLKSVSEGNINNSLSTVFEKELSGKLNGCVMVCKVDGKNIDYIFSKKSDNELIIEYKKEKRNTENDSYNEVTLNKQDLLSYADNIHKKLIKDLKNNGNQLFSIQDKLVNMIKSEISKGNIKDTNNNTVKAAIYLGARAAVSHVFWLFDSIKAGLKVCYLLHSLMINNIHNYTKLLQYYNEKGCIYGDPKNLEIKYLHGNKKYPYIHIPYNSLMPNCGGFCLPKIDELQKYFGNNDYRSVIHLHDLSRDIVLMKIIFNLTSFTDILYFHEMGHAVLQSNDEIAASFYEAYFKAKEAGEKTDIIENYVGSIIENQADAFAVYKLGLRIRTTFNNYAPLLKDLGVSNSEIEELFKKYENNIKKQIPLVSKYAKQSTWAKMKSLFRDYGN